jgi:SM-20-related protein
LNQQPDSTSDSDFGDSLTDAVIASLGRGHAIFFDGALEDQVAKEVRKTALSMDGRGALRRGGVGREAARHLDIRGDRMAWLDPADLPPGLEPVLCLFEEVMLALNEQAFLGARSLECQITVFHDQHGYARHRDATTDASSRRATAIYYANSWETGDGGELEVWEDEGARLLAPLANRLVIFRSQFTEHAVRAVIGKPRVAVSAFMHN